jgi:hypothetical protein
MAWCSVKKHRDDFTFTFKVMIVVYFDSGAGIAQWYTSGVRTGWWGFESRQELRIFLFTTASRPALGATPPHIQWVSGALSLGVKRPGRETDHSPPSSAEVKECVELCLHSLNTPSYSGAQLKHRDLCVCCVGGTNDEKCTGDKCSRIYGMGRLADESQVLLHHFCIGVWTVSILGAVCIAGCSEYCILELLIFRPSVLSFLVRGKAVSLLLTAESRSVTSATWRVCLVGTSYKDDQFTST